MTRKDLAVKFDKLIKENKIVLDNLTNRHLIKQWKTRLAALKLVKDIFIK